MTYSYVDDFRYWALDGDRLISWAKASSVPEEYWDSCSQIQEAISFVNRIGACGDSQHHIKSEHHRTVLAVLRHAVDLYGEIFPIVYRGDSSPKTDSDYAIMFGALDPEVASFYGTLRERRNVRGLRTRSCLKSVVTNDWTASDDEIIFSQDEQRSVEPYHHKF